jgi:hypothetical protein
MKSRVRLVSDGDQAEAVSLLGQLIQTPEGAQRLAGMKAASEHAVRIVAESGSLEEARARLEANRRECDEIGNDPAWLTNRLCR